METIAAYRPLVRAMAKRYHGPGLEFEDLEQEAWLALVMAEKSYRPELNVPRPAFYKSRVRAALASMLRKYRRDALFWRGTHVELRGEWSESDFDLLLSTLPSRQRQVLGLYYREGWKLPEISRQLGISVSAAHTYKTRGLRALARQLTL